MQIILKLIVTGFISAMYFAALYFVWTKEIDVYRTLTKPLSAFLETNDYNSIQIDYSNVMVARFILEEIAPNGNLGLIFYNTIKFVNSTDKKPNHKERAPPLRN